MDQKRQAEETVEQAEEQTLKPAGESLSKLGTLWLNF